MASASVFSVFEEIGNDLMPEGRIRWNRPNDFLSHNFMVNSGFIFVIILNKKYKSAALFYNINSYIWVIGLYFRILNKQVKIPVG